MRKIFLLMLLISTTCFPSFRAASKAEQKGGFRKAISEFLPLAKGGSLAAEVKLGYIFGTDLREYQKSKYWYDLAAASGAPEAISSLGTIYQLGLGVPVDQKKAFRYFKKAAYAGMPNGIENLAVSYLYGQGVNQNIDLALFWMTRAADLNIPEALYSLGIIYSDGWLVDQDMKKSISSYSRASQLGYVPASETLGQLYQAGKYPLPGDPIQAYKWYSIAVMQKNKHSIIALKILKQKMTQVQIKQAEKNLHVYLKKHPIKIHTNG